jgi:hypothetical protein
MVIDIWPSAWKMSIKKDYFIGAESSSIRRGALAPPDHAVAIRDWLGVCDGCESVHRGIDAH